jgi:hypothetical protein
VEVEEQQMVLHQQVQVVQAEAELVVLVKVLLEQLTQVVEAEVQIDYHQVHLVVVQEEKELLY